LKDRNVTSSNVGDDNIAVKQALNQTVRSNTKPVALWLGVMYMIFAVGHYFLLPNDIKLFMTSLAVITFITLFAISFVSQHIRLTKRLSLPIAFFIPFLAMVNSACHLFLAEDILQTSNFVLIIMGSSYLLLSTPWFLLLVFTSTFIWGVLTANLVDPPHVVHFTFAILSAAIVAIVLHIIRMRDLIENQRLHISNEARSEEVEYIATHDFLTGLPNRRLFMDRLTMAVTESKRSNTKIGVLFCDLNAFKLMNDTRGHEFGDAVLKKVATDLSALIREVDTLARLGGDEFAILFKDLSGRSDLTALTSRIPKTLKSPENTDFLQIEVGISIGEALFPDDADEVGQLLNHADKAMYKSKQLLEKNVQNKLSFTLTKLGGK
jgi:diguanylate cyclase (GGDEF)-like protein